MKKLYFFPVILLSALLLAPTFYESSPSKAVLKNKIQGVWKIISYTDVNGDKRSWIREKYKFITKERFAWIDYNNDTGGLLGSGGGTYSFDGSTYTETLEYYLADSTVIGTEIMFTARFEKGKWLHKGVFTTPHGDINIDEVWEKVE